MNLDFSNWKPFKLSDVFAFIMAQELQKKKLNVIPVISWLFKAVKTTMAVLER